jgi:hypothetical protein
MAKIEHAAQYAEYRYCALRAKGAEWFCASKLERVAPDKAAQAAELTTRKPVFRFVAYGLKFFSLPHYAQEGCVEARSASFA